VEEQKWTSWCSSVTAFGERIIGALICLLFVTKIELDFARIVKVTISSNTWHAFIRLSPAVRLHYCYIQATSTAKVISYICVFVIVEINRNNINFSLCMRRWIVAVSLLWKKTELSGRTRPRENLERESRVDSLEITDSRFQFIVKCRL